jgi:repressor LexA
MRRDKIALLAKALQVTPAFIMGLEDDNFLPINAAPVGELVNIPILGRVAAGNGCYASEDIDGYEPVSPAWLAPGERYIFLRVHGDSMWPKYLENDLLLVQCQTSVDSGSIAVVTIDDEEGVVKKIEYGKDWIELISENPYYPVRRFEGRDILRIKVIGLVKRLIREV